MSLFDWTSKYSIHLDTAPPPDGRVWFVAKLANRKRPTLMVAVSNVQQVAAYFRSEADAEAFAELLGGKDAE